MKNNLPLEIKEYGLNYKKQYRQILNQIKKHDDIVIFRHIMPDFDALGSQFGLYTWLKDNFPQKSIHVVGDNHVAGSERLEQPEFELRGFEPGGSDSALLTEQRHQNAAGAAGGNAHITSAAVVVHPGPVARGVGFSASGRPLNRHHGGKIPRIVERFGDPFSYDRSDQRHFLGRLGLEVDDRGAERLERTVECAGQNVVDEFVVISKRAFELDFAVPEHIERVPPQPFEQLLLRLRVAADSRPEHIESDVDDVA